MEKLKEQIRILSAEEAELLKADKLPKRLKIATGLYLVCSEGKYTGYDYAERQSWIESFGNKSKAQEGWSKEFDDPLNAIDWLFELK